MGNDSFDERVDDYLQGEGFGIVTLKSVEAALRDGDTLTPSGSTTTRQAQDKPNDGGLNLIAKVGTGSTLIAVELRNWFMEMVKVDVALFEILGGATMLQLGHLVAEKLRNS
ncbi:hypothetical protein CHU98_g10816 [Xylaria longipes]|nr:hypothetical protein CHU98_g10816 [Xylaria longipes]